MDPLRAWPIPSPPRGPQRTSLAIRSQSMRGGNSVEQELGIQSKWGGRLQALGVVPTPTQGVRLLWASRPSRLELSCPDGVR